MEEFITIETGWLIEKESGLCLGVSGCKELYWTIPDLAVRFAREEDANNMKYFLIEHKYTSQKLFVAEHSWEGI